MILAIETATQVCSVALQLDSGEIVEKRETGRGIHSEKLFIFMDHLLKEHDVRVDDLQEVLLSRGPGQYTGLRIGAAGVKGLLFERKVPLFLFGTLEAIAAGVTIGRTGGGTLHAVIDARREHLYYQRFRFSSQNVVFGEAVIEELKVIDRQIEKGHLVAGTGLERLDLSPDREVHLFDHTCISAISLLKARGDSRFDERFVEADPAHFEPEYLTSGQVNNSQTR